MRLFYLLVFVCAIAFITSTAQAQYIRPICVGGCIFSGFVYNDADNNGDFNSGDTGLSGHTVELYYSDSSYTQGAFATSATTDSTGHYSISGIPQNAYYIIRHTSLPAGSVRVNPIGGGFGVYSAQDYFSLNFGIRTTPLLQQSPQPSCNGPISNIYTNWTPYPGAADYKVFYLDSSVGVAEDGGNTGGLTYKNMTTAQGLIEGHGYGLVIAALNGSGNAIAYSDSGQWSHQKFGAFTLFPVCSPPPPPTLSQEDSLCVNRPGSDDNQVIFKITSGATGIINLHLDEDTIYKGSTAPPGNPYISVFLSPGEPHTYTSRVQTTPGTSGPSNGLNITGSNCVLPPPPPTLSVESDTCVDQPGLADRQIRFRFTSAAPGIINYHLDRNAVNQGSVPPGNPYTYMDVFLTATEAYNYTSRVQTPTGTSTASNTEAIAAKNCQVPIANFKITTPSGPINAPGIPAFANQNSSVVLDWNPTQGATSCTASAVPPQSYWSTVPVAGPRNVDTSLAAGPITFSLFCSNANGPGPTQTLQLTIDQFPRPYFQTTGGDVHTNENIYITP